MSNQIKLNIVMYVNGLPFDGDTLKTKSLGGSETAGLYMARELSKIGHDVTVFSNCGKGGKFDGVTYIDLSAFSQYTAYSDIDVLITQRVPQMFAQTTRSKLNILWQHDLATKNMRSAFTGSLWNIDTVFGLSDYHIKQMGEIYQVSDDVFHKTRNGVADVEINSKIERKPKRLIYTARPERGLDILLNDIMPKVWEKDPEVELVLAGYENTVEQMRPFYESLRAKAAEHVANGFKVTHLGALTKRQLHDEYQRATLYVYPTNFEEISCITAMECMANGLPMLCTSLAALPETLKADGTYIKTGHAMVIKGDANSEKYQKQFVDYIMDSINSCQDTKDIRTAQCLEVAKGMQWSAVAQEWSDYFIAQLKNKTNDKEKLAGHFYRNEDIMALQALDLPVWNERIEKEYPFIKDSGAYKDIYIEQGEHFQSVMKDKDLQLQPYLRLKVSVDCLKKSFSKKPPRDILDYGGGIGNEAIQLVNEFGCGVTSVNISAAEQEVGKKLAEKHCKHPEKITWVIAASPEEVTGTFDAIFAGEILEHVPDPTAFIKSLEEHCSTDGRMIFTVPLGSWGDTANTTEYRGHLWSYDKHDLVDLFGKKHDLDIKIVSGQMNPHNLERLGWYVVSYKHNGMGVGTIDMDRKLMLQNPRQTVSACMIVGGRQEGLLHRCLQSIYPVVDEICILDTGMSEESRRIIDSEEYAGKIKIKKGLCPLEHGFDTARNESIKMASCDWILWVDSDEELLGANKMFKYLRNNGYRGYSIRQNHLSVQPPNAFKADLPTRLFRNDGRIKFFGVVHEHPEEKMNEGIGMSTVLHDVDLAHDGYLTEDIRRGKFQRNFPLMVKDREKYPERVLGKFLMIRDRMHQVRYMLEQTNGQLPQEAIDLCNIVVKEYREDFLGKPSLMSTDGLMYYGEALRILNKGFEYYIDLGVRPQEAHAERPEPVMVRFETIDDFMAYIKNKAQELSEPYEGKYVA